MFVLFFGCFSVDIVNTADVYNCVVLVERNAVLLMYLFCVGATPINHVFLVGECKGQVSHSVLYRNRDKLKTAAVSGRIDTPL